MVRGNRIPTLNANIFKRWKKSISFLGYSNIDRPEEDGDGDICEWEKSSRPYLMTL